MDALGTVKQIYTIARLIYDQAKKVNVNQAQCQLLAERVAVIESAIKKLGKLPDNEAFCQSLTRLRACLSEIQHYMQDLSGVSWFRRFLNARSHEATFQDFNKRLTLAISELSLGLDAQALLNREADQKAAQADHQVLLSKQDDILRLNEALLTRVNKIADKGFHQRQHDSMVIRMDQLLQMMARMGESKAPAAAPSSPKSPAEELDSRITIPYFALTLEAKLSQGTFGKIYRGLWHEKTVVIKVWDGRLTEQEKQQFIRETQILQRLKSPSYVPQFYGACLEANQACLVLEYCPLGSLDSVLTRQSLTPVQRRELALSIAKGLQFLHSKDVIHRYFKSANVLLSEDKPGGVMQAKITGFGLSKTHYPSIVSAQLQLSELMAGLAPEVLSGKEATMAADAFSYGTVLWELLTERHAFTQVNPSQLLSGYQEDCRGVDPAYARLIQRCWSLDPRQRPLMTEIIATLTPLSPPAALAVAAAPVSVAAPPADQPSSPVFGLPALLPPQALRADAETPAPAISLKSALSALVPPRAAVSDYERAKIAHTQKNYAQARRDYEAALAAGEEKARVKLATLLIRGDGGQPEEIKTDQARAVELFQQAAAKNDVLAIQNLVKALKHGIGCPTDEKAAAEWQKRLQALNLPGLPSASQNSAATPHFRSSQPSQAPAVNVFARRAGRPGLPIRNNFNP